MLLFLQVNWVSREWAKRAALPSHVVTMLDNFPTNLHPMSQFSAAITALNSESSFARAYSEGVHKSKYWEVSSHLRTHKTNLILKHAGGPAYLANKTSAYSCKSGKYE